MVEHRGGAAAFDDLERELVAVGRVLVIEPPRDDLVERTLARIGTNHVAQSKPLASRVRRRIAWATAALAVLAVAAVPPVRAAVLELFRLGAVVVRQEPAPVGPPANPSAVAPSRAAPSAPTGPLARLTLAEARAAVAFPFTVPSVLGPPTTVAVTHQGRVVELAWSSTTTAGTTTRLDVLSGAPDYGYLKQVWTELTPTKVGDHDALWIGADHELQWVDHSGATETAPARTAGPTLVWVVPTSAGEVTYRLEGLATLEEALEIAGSAG
jgi:hypothetical protein